MILLKILHIIGCLYFREFNGTEGKNSVEIITNSVKVLPSSSNHQTGSSSLRVRNIVDYGWEHRYSIGRLVATHMSGSYIAYAVTGESYIYHIAEIEAYWTPLPEALEIVGPKTDFQGKFHSLFAVSIFLN